MKKIRLTELVLGALFITIALFLPFLTAQIPQVGQALLPMHIPVLLCGFICGARIGAIVGFASPIIRSLIFTMPPMTEAIPMAFELCAYGLIAGLLFYTFKKNVIISLVAAMIGGRIIWGIVKFITMTAMGNAFGIELFFTLAFTNAVIGMIVQIVLIPMIVFTLEKSDLLPRSEQKNA